MQFLRCITWRFNKQLCCEVIPTISLINTTVPSHSYLLCVRVWQEHLWSTLPISVFDHFLLDKMCGVIPDFLFFSPSHISCLQIQLNSLSSKFRIQPFAITLTTLVWTTCLRGKSTVRLKTKNQMNKRAHPAPEPHKHSFARYIQIRGVQNIERYLLWYNQAF